MSESLATPLDEGIAPQERYKFKPFYGSSHVWALEECRSFSFDSPVLDIGPGSGAIGHELRERGFKSLTAVEIDARAREHARTIYDRVEETIVPLEGQKYSLILLLDVLEHLTDPAPFLEQVVKLLEPGGTLLISVPNIAHWSIRLSLLFGSFNYTERGLLDRTHYHFFTRKSLHGLIKGHGRLSIVKEDATIVPLQFLVPENIAKTKAFHWGARVRLAAAQLFPGLCAFQLLVRVQKQHFGR